MKIPVEWLKEYIDIKKDSKEIADSFTQLGLMLDKPIEAHADGSYTTDILDLEHRMDRADWLSIIGCARDLAAFEGLDLNYPKVHAESGKTPTADQKISIEVKVPEIVNRFNTRVFRGVKVKKSPGWLKNRLEAYGIPSINNIVDITNYVMVEYGQPMHAQDLAKMTAPEIVIRRAKEGEEVVTLLGEKVTLTPDQFVLTQHDVATVIGGIVGGETTAVDEKTTDFVLDAGNYNQTNIRKSARSLKVQNETVLRYDKFLHPDLTQRAIERATALILEIAGGEYYENEDYYPTQQQVNKMALSFGRIEQVGGMKIAPARVKEILEALEYVILGETSQGLELEVPFYRTDVVVEDDLVADVLRINDYTNIPVAMIDSAPPPEITSEVYKFEQRLRDVMISMGFHEHITDPLVPTDETEEEQVRLDNALTSDKSALRMVIRETLQPVMTNYQKHGAKEVNLFEVARVYKLLGNPYDHASYKEERALETVIKNFDISPHENSRQTKKVLGAVLQELGVDLYELAQGKYGTDVLVDDNFVGIVHSFGFTLYSELLLGHVQDNTRVMSELKPLTVENFSLIVDLDVKFGPILYEISKFSEEIVSAEVIEEYTGKEIKGDKKTILVKVVYNTSETAPIRDKLLPHLKDKYAIEHRD